MPPVHPAPCFRLEGVIAGPDDAPILRGVTVDIPTRGITCLLGRSGSGKTTLLRLLDRLDDPIAGSIGLDGAPLAELDPIALRRRVAMVFQRPPLFDGDVLANLCVARPDLNAAVAAEVVGRVGLDAELLGRDARDLSGGEAQRMCFARALLTSPDVVLADEPTASLDGAARLRIEELARRIAAEGVGIVWVTHDPAQVRRLADRVVVLVDGVVAAAGTLAEIDADTRASVRELLS